MNNKENKPVAKMSLFERNSKNPYALIEKQNRLLSEGIIELQEQLQQATKRADEVENKFNELKTFINSTINCYEDDWSWERNAKNGLKLYEEYNHNLTQANEKLEKAKEFVNNYIILQDTLKAGYTIGIFSDARPLKIEFYNKAQQLLKELSDE